MIDGEKQLIESAIRGEASAFGLLYDRYQPQIYRFIYLKVSHREEAEDLTHQVFLQSWKKIGEYNFQGFPFTSWLYKIARNEIIDHYRTKKIHLDVDDMGMDDEPGLPAENLLIERLDSEIDAQRVKAAITQLSLTEQDVLILRFIEDLSPTEVAQIIDRTPAAVRLIQHRAIKSLKKIINAK